MCEPSHSIIQYNDPNDPMDDDMNGSAQAGSFKISQLTNGLGKWAKKIKKWFHLSMMGQGHSETIGARGTSLRYSDDVFALYEAHWWNRTVKYDGYRALRVSEFFRDQMMQCATKYANMVSIGDDTQLRRFLGESMKNSDRPHSYVDQVHSNLLNADGKIEMERQCKVAFKMPFTRANIIELSENKLNNLIKFTLGFTRKRKLLVPEWADDNRIWVPNDGKVVVSS